MTRTEMKPAPAVTSGSTDRLSVPDRLRAIPKPQFGPLSGVLIALAVLVIYLGITQVDFLTWRNVTNIVSSNSVTLLMAVGATFVIVSGGIDLSAAGVVTTVGMVFALLLRSGMNIFLALAVMIAAALGIGAINVVLITRVKISFLVVTLGAGTVWTSAALVLNGGNSASAYDAPGFHFIDSFVNGDVAGIPYLLVFDVLVVLAASFVLRHTTYGRALFAVGSNPEAARLNGIKPARIEGIVYLIAALSSAVAAVVLVGRLTSAPASPDPNLLLNVIAAVLIGGTNVGVGGVGATVAGVAFLGVAQNGLTLTGVSPFWQGIISGSILIVAVGLGGLRRRRRRIKVASSV